MKTLTVVMVVVLMLVFAVATYAQGGNAGGPAPGAAGGGGRGGGGGMRGMGGGFGMQMAPPAVMTFEGFIYVILGNVIYKVDPKTVTVVGATFLMPPGLVTAGGGPLPPPAP